MNRQLKILTPQKAQVVVDHARQRGKRGRGPSMRYGKYTNQRALAEAQRDLENLDADLALWAKSHEHYPGESYASIAKGDDGARIIIKDPEAATIVAGYEAMILSIVEKEKAAEAA